jgi:hypothetical protein
MKQIGGSQLHSVILNFIRFIRFYQAGNESLGKSPSSLKSPGSPAKSPGSMYNNRADDSVRPHFFQRKKENRPDGPFSSMHKKNSSEPFSIQYPAFTFP